jgi:hypothetical protein
MSLWRNGLFLSLLIPLLSQQCNRPRPITQIHHRILALCCSTPRQSGTAQYIRLLQLDGHLCGQTLLLYFLQTSNTQLPCSHNILLGLSCIHSSGMVCSSNLRLVFYPIHQPPQRATRPERGSEYRVHCLFVTDRYCLRHHECVLFTLSLARSVI